MHTLANGEQIALPSLILGLPAEVYHASDGVSNSNLKDFRRSPAHYRFAVRKETDAFRLGSVLHAATLEPGTFEATHIVEPSGDNVPRRPSKPQRNAKNPSDETLAAIAFWHAFNESAAAKTIVTASHFERVQGMLAGIRRHDDARRLLGQRGRAEASAFALDEETGLVLRSRKDFLPDEEDADAIVDVKTCEDASEREFARAAFDYGYHKQAAFYLDNAHRVGETRRKRFVFIAIEKAAPYAVATWELDEAAIDLGREEYRKQLPLFAQCLEIDSWPAYTKQRQALSLPAYAFKS